MDGWTAATVQSHPAAGALPPALTGKLALLHSARYLNHQTNLQLLYLLEKYTLQILKTLGKMVSGMGKPG